MEQVLFVLLFLIVFAFLAHWKKVLDAKGIVMALALGILSFVLGQKSAVGGWTALGVIVLFFVLGESVTRWARLQRGPKHEVRGIGNIIGNAGVAVLALALQQPLAFFAAMACALSDTFSSEIGMLSKEKPFDILSGKTIQTGKNGGVSMLGEGVALLGAAIIAMVYWIAFQNVSGTILVLVSGFLGQVADSVLGSRWEEKRKLDNTQVNFLATLTAALLALVLSTLLRI